MNFSEDTLTLINKKIHELELLKKKNQKKIIRPINITTTERVDIEKTFRIVSKTIEDLKKNGKIYPGPEYREKYIHLEEPNECNICYNTYRENFKCKRCVFKCCRKCFNRFYFESSSICPMCKY